MHLIIRPIAVQELASGLECVRDFAFYDASEKKRILNLWHSLFRQRRSASACIEDRDETFGRRILCFGIGAFVGPEVAREINHGQLPYAQMRLLERWEGGSDPFLTADEIAAANASGGLHFLNLASGMPRTLLFSREAEPILNKNQEFFHCGIAGYRLNEVLVECYGTQEAELARGMGYRLRESVESALQLLGVSPPPERYPYVVGTTALEARHLRGTLQAAIFDYAPPALGLSASEQEVLAFALAGCSDMELAERLSISFATVRQRWSCIYEKVAGKLPKLFLDQGGAPRGGEKRRHVIQYALTHREELRAYAPAIEQQ